MHELALSLLSPSIYGLGWVCSFVLTHAHIHTQANVMLSYPIDEAIELLQKRLSGSQQSYKVVEEDLAFLRDQITTMEVNTARIHNWDVKRRREKWVWANEKERGTHDFCDDVEECRWKKVTPQSKHTLRASESFHWVCIVSIVVMLATTTSAMIGTPATTMIRTLV